jgi:hypothetical protein
LAESVRTRRAVEKVAEVLGLFLIRNITLGVQTTRVK